VIRVSPAPKPEPSQRDATGRPGDLRGAARRLLEQGFVHLTESRPDWKTVKRDALDVMTDAATRHPIAGGLPALTSVGEFLVPPPGAVSRDFQALHIDFGWPLVAERPVDLARFTVLSVAAEVSDGAAATRVVPLRRLLGQRSWPSAFVLAQRLRRAADPARSVEGILGRLIEILDEGGGSLPASTTPGFLCGMEFSSRLEEDRFFRSHGMELATVEDQIVLQRGELLVLDNLRMAHGRLGRRRTCELHQLFVGYRGLGADAQGAFLDGILSAFHPV
jgi:hypothetical protein